jgi:hypothetical protein
MKHFTFLFIILLLFTLATSNVAGERDIDWNRFSQSLVKAFKSGNEGLKQSAMQRIIQYSDQLSVQKAAFQLYNIYRWHKNTQVRQLALVALYKSNNEWAMNQLVKAIKIEKSPVLRRQMIFMIDEYFKNKPINDLNNLVYIKL